MAVKAKVVECAPNFSEGRDEATIQAIASAIRDTEGCSLLDVEPGASTNRTVYTFFGSPSAVVEGALNGAEVARRRIDMAKQSGEHPRIGALDVCPFIPISNVTTEECVQCSREFGRRLGEQMHVPVYLYEDSQDKEHRKSLPQIRKGEYEGLLAKLQDPLWAPDYGPAEFVSSWGATVTGARKILIAYNVNLMGTKEQAHRIALDIRTLGRGPKERGLLKEVRALGWYLEEQDLAQVSINLSDFNVTSLHTVYEECCSIAKTLNVAVVGSEVVGLVPLTPMLMAAEYYMKKEGLFILQEAQKIRLAVDRLGLNSISEFKPKEKIIEYCIGSNKDGALLSGSLRSFVEQLGARSSAPGGGSAAACIGSLGAALATMVGLLTFGKRKYESLDGTMRTAIVPLHTAMQDMLTMVDRDTEAFTDYMTALKLPKATEEEKTIRSQAMQAGLKKAIQVPLDLMRTATSCWPHVTTIAEHGNITALSDIQVSAHSLDTGIRGGYYNVCINLKQVADEDYVGAVTAEVEEMARASTASLEAILDIAKKREK